MIRWCKTHEELPEMQACPYCKGEGCDAAWCDERHPGPRNNDGSLVVQEGTDT